MLTCFQISGDANEKQILNAATAYIDRSEVLQRVLNDLYHLFRYDHCAQISKALNVVLNAMDRHISEKHIQISGSATLFYIVKNKDIPPFPAKIKRTTITTLLNGMNAHRDDDTMMRNGCLTLCQFKIPHDVLVNTFSAGPADPRGVAIVSTIAQCEPSSRPGRFLLVERGVWFRVDLDLYFVSVSRVFSMCK
ncbi:regulation of ligase activity protein [Homalodisca vitripennis]|nr:regulation of ligase activity protein [Homalodisca vitripennis]